MSYGQRTGKSSIMSGWYPWQQLITRRQAQRGVDSPASPPVPIEPRQAVVMPTNDRFLLTLSVRHRARNPAISPEHF